MIGVRRKFIPPLLDTYQDMIFVMYGPTTDPHKLNGDITLIRELEDIINSISPAVSSKSREESKNKSQEDLKNKEPEDPKKTKEYIPDTYFDVELLQSRANSLSLSNEAYSWFKYRQGMDIPFLR